MLNSKTFWKWIEIATFFTTILPEIFNSVDIDRILQSDRRTNLAFRGVFASDELPESATTSSLYVCNTDPSTEPGEHWIVVYIDSNIKADYFDSCGMHPLIKNFKNFLYNNSTIWMRNNKPVQYLLLDACGYHRIFYVLHRCIAFSMNALINIDTDNLLFNDEIVKEFVCTKMI